MPPDPLAAFTDVEAFRAIGHQVVDRLADYLKAVQARELPVVGLVPPAQLQQQWPPAFGPPDPAALPGLVDRWIAQAVHQHHPRYVGHQVSPPVPVAALVELVAALLNNGMAAYEAGPVSTVVERSVIRWMCDAVGYGPAADGVLTHGGSIGNLTALLVARQARAGWDAWTEGNAKGPELAVITTDQSHYCVSRSAQIMGLGDAGVIRVPTDERFRMRTDRLEDALAEAGRRGRRVFAVIASACSTSTGSFDRLPEIADFCARAGLWMHVDGAHGASLALSRKYRALVEGIERADSIVWDAHKTLLMPGLVTSVLFRDAAPSHNAFAQRAAYLFDRPDPEVQAFNLGTRTLECTKRMMALKLYATLTLYGPDAFGLWLDGLIDRALSFARMIRESPDFELALEPFCNIVCFRYRPLDDEGQDRLRERIIGSGRFYLVRTRLEGRVYLRTTVMNPLTTDDDLRALLDELRGASA